MNEINEYTEKIFEEINILMKMVENIGLLVNYKLF